MKPFLPVIILLVVCSGCSKRFAFRNTVKVHRTEESRSEKIAGIKKQDAEEPAVCAAAKDKYLPVPQTRIAKEKPLVYHGKERKAGKLKDEYRAGDLHEHSSAVKPGDDPPPGYGDPRYNTHAILGFLLCLVPFLLVISGIVGLILCFKGLKSEHPGLARAGIVIFFLWLVFFTVLLVSLFLTPQPGP